MPGHPFPGNLSAHQTAGLTLGADRSRGNSLAAGIELLCCLGVAVVGLNIGHQGSPVHRPPHGPCHTFEPGGNAVLGDGCFCVAANWKAIRRSQWQRP
jgi:hypothetical protein